jgi:glyoxylase-like metal-dependent hydrolase (beta-lactamase superfamily II)
MNVLGVALAVAALVGAMSSVRAQTAGQALPSAANPVREISKIAGEVYRFRNNAHYSIFVVTSDGIIATDPINKAAAEWLRGELKTRFPDKPVKYLVYSHDHADHVSGGEVFADTAIVVAHANARSAIIGEKRPTAVPTVTFTDRMDIDLGGTKLELHYVGRNHSNNSLVMRLPAEKVVFAVDFIPVNSVGFRDWPDAYLEEWIESLKRVEAMEFDILAPGHGELGGKKHVVAFRSYMEDLRNQVLAAVRAGKTLEETKALVDVTKYKDWGGFQQMGALNVEGMYRLVAANRRPN